MMLFVIGIILAVLVWKLLKYHRPKFQHANHAPVNLRENLINILKKSQTWYIALYVCLLWTRCQLLHRYGGTLFNGYEASPAKYGGLFMFLNVIKSGLW